MPNDNILGGLKVQRQDFDEEGQDDFQVEFEILPAYDKTYLDPRRASIAEKIEEIEAMENALDSKIENLNSEIDRLTAHGDNVDYWVAVGVGVICGAIDSFVIGEFKFEESKAGVHKHINEFIQNFAKSKGYKGDRLGGAINKLEKLFPVAQDNIWKGADIGVNTNNHHLADFAHHPTLLGLVSSVVVQLIRTGLFVNKDGEWHFMLVETDPKELLKIWSPIIMSGFMLWILNVIKNKNEDNFDKTIPKPLQKLIKYIASVPAIIPIIQAIANWRGHMVSDMGGSKNTPGGGMGIPGMFVSLLYEISSVPPLNQTGLPKLINDWYAKSKIDMRNEDAFLMELGRQAIPVFIGEVLVRLFYFVRRLAVEVKKQGKLKDVDWKKIDWKSTIPFNNRTIARMMTIEAGTFTAIDLADATIRSAMKNGSPQNPFFWSDILLRVNFVGVGRFFIAVGTDIGMGFKRSKNVKDRLKIQSEKTMLKTAKIFYYQKNMWIEAQDTAKAIDDMLVTGEKSIIFYMDSVTEISKDVERIGSYVPGIKEHNPELNNKIIDILKW